MNFSIAEIYILFCRVEHSLSCYPTPANAFLAAAMFSPHEKKSSALHARMGT